MKAKVLLCVALIAAAVCYTVYASVTSKQPFNNYFILIYTPGQAWNTGLKTDDQPYLKSHSRHLSQLRKNGVIVTGGRYSNKGMIIVQAENIEVAEQIIKADSAVINHTFDAEIYPYSVFYDGSLNSIR